MTGLLILALTAHAGTAPTARVWWRRSVATLWVDAPPGEHLAPSAPVDGWLEIDGSHLELRTDGAVLERGLAVALPDSEVTVTGELRVSLCEDGGTACRLADVGFQGILTGKRGRLLLDTYAPRATTGVSTPPPDLDADTALARASDDGKLVLLDFSATWCPPCNQLSAEVLHDLDDQAPLEPFHVVIIDVDDPSSWTLKNRYEVGGYPTIVVVDAEGREVDRSVGYDGEAPFIAWLRDLSGADILTTPPEPGSLEPEAAGAWAWKLVQRDRSAQAAPYLARAAQAKEPFEELALARLHTTGHVPDATWLVENARSPVESWIWPALQAAETATELKKPLQALLRNRLVESDASTASQLLSALAQLSEGSEAQSLYSAAAYTLNGALSRDPGLDRGYWSQLARLYEEAGQHEQARALLEHAVRSFPEEFTFHHAQARMYQRLGQLPEALTAAQKALEYSYGDNRLRAVSTLAKVLRDLGQVEEGLEFVQRTIAETERPPTEILVRTHRYLDALEDLGQELASPDP
ncbi:MAG: thioredoxin domain-containing protein [Myxococcota bacterium]|nr:thioredoxin domain-containing protein [Myxococcota bacterium]